jgi:hypothetical protein
MILLIVKLLLSHLLGDFVFQPYAWVKSKEEEKVKSIYLYLHILIHAMLLFILLGIDSKYWISILIIAVSHYGIDLTKLYLKGRINERKLFLFDQLAHILVLAGVVQFFFPYLHNMEFLYSKNFISIVLSLILLTSVSSIVMKMVMSRWKLNEDDQDDSLNDAGKYIGILERLFVFGFILMSQWGAIGFLLTAKSVFRFGDLSKAKDRKLTEYILIGTLLSFGIAILIGLLCVSLIRYTD